MRCLSICLVCSTGQEGRNEGMEDIPSSGLTAPVVVVVIFMLTLFLLFQYKASRCRGSQDDKSPLVKFGSYLYKCGLEI